jgi:hypothetical protein
MFDGREFNVRSRAISPLRRIAGGAAHVTLSPFASAAAVIGRRTGTEFAHRIIEPLLDSPEVATFLSAALDDRRVRTTAKTIVESDSARQLLASFFEGGLFDDVVDRLLASEGLWRLIDEIAVSPAVSAAVTQQGLGFADQVGEEVRSRSRGADDWLERAARRLVRRSPDRSAPRVEAPNPIAP